jgi:hypothetical protein
VSLQDDLPSRVKKLIEAGAVEWNGEKLQPYQPVATNRGKKSLSDLIIEDRE